MVVGFSFRQKGERTMEWEEGKTSKMLDWNYWHELITLKLYFLAQNAKRA